MVREVVGVLVMDVGGLEGRGEVIVDILLCEGCEVICRPRSSGDSGAHLGKARCTTGGLDG